MESDIPPPDVHFIVYFLAGDTLFAANNDCDYHGPDWISLPKSAGTSGIRRAATSFSFWYGSYDADAVNDG